MRSVEGGEAETTWFHSSRFDIYVCNFVRCSMLDACIVLHSSNLWGDSSKKIRKRIDGYCPQMCLVVWTGVSMFEWCTCPHVFDAIIVECRMRKCFKE